MVCANFLTTLIIFLGLSKNIYLCAMMLTKAEENYIKAIYKLTESERKNVSTNAISSEIQTTAASVTDMLKRLADKDLIHYEKYKGVTLSTTGKEIATALVRKHRLWETFLVEKLDFAWDEVHDIAEELEHIDSEKLVNRLDAFLGYPKYDPHGDPIPNVKGKFTMRRQLPLTELNTTQKAIVVGVREHSGSFLRHLSEVGIGLHKEVALVERFDYDDTLKIAVEGVEQVISSKVARNIFVKTT